VTVSTDRFPTTNQEFPLYLGIDERSKVRREQIGDKIRDSWLSAARRCIISRPR